MFNFFRKKRPEDVFRKKVREGFDHSVKNVRGKLVGDSLMDGLLVQSAIGNFAQAMKQSPGTIIISMGSQGWSRSPEAIIDEETERAIKKYLK